MFDLVLFSSLIKSTKLVFRCSLIGDEWLIEDAGAVDDR